MLRSCFRGLAVAGLAAGLCLPVIAQRQFTPSEHLMHDVIASHFGLTHQQVMDLHGKAWSYEDIATAANIAARSGRPLSDVVAARDRGTQWSAIASQYSLRDADVWATARVAGMRTTMAEPMAGSSKYAMPNTDIVRGRRGNGTIRNP